MAVLVKDTRFYTTFFRLTGTIALQNLIVFSVNLADNIMLGAYGETSLAGVALVNQIQFLLQMIVMGVGEGIIVLSAQYWGKGQTGPIRRTVGIGLWCGVLASLALAAVVFLFPSAVLGLLTNDASLIAEGVKYLRIICFTYPLFAVTNVLLCSLRGVETVRIGFLVSLTTLVINTCLNYILIYGHFGAPRLGVRGAAIATLLSQCVSFAILLACFLRRKSAVRLHIGQVSRKAEVYARIIKTGMPSFCRQSLASVATVLLNVNAAVYGDAAVAAMSVVGRIFMFVFSFMLGFGQGFQPVAGYNFGAKRYDRVRGATYFTMLVGTVLMSVLAAAGFLAAPGALALFRRDDAEVIAIGALALRAQCVVLPLFGVSTVTNMLLQVTGQSGQATFLSLCRQGIFFVPFILLLPQLIGLLGVQLAQPAADLCTFAVTLPFLLSFLRRLKLWEQAERAVAEK